MSRIEFEIVVRTKYFAEMHIIEVETPIGTYLVDFGLETATFLPNCPSPRFGSKFFSFPKGTEVTGPFFKGIVRAIKVPPLEVAGGEKMEVTFFDLRDGKITSHNHPEGVREVYLSLDERTAGLWGVCNYPKKHRWTKHGLMLSLKFFGC